ncbi:MAG: hypothetical protein WCD81_06065 [Candidatus Bathyarchaeia archaeon]
MNNNGQFSIIAALLVAVILITTVIATYSTIRSSPVQNQAPILNAIDETNLAIKQILGFTLGYYGSVLQVTGNVSYAQAVATSYLQSGLQNIANMHPEWGTSINLNSSALHAYWFSSTSYSSGSLTVNYDLPGLGILGVSYQASCELTVQIINTTTGQACLSITQDQSQPLVTLGQQNFDFYQYNNTSSTWQLANPTTEPTAYANGTYYVNLPSGINPYSYVVQVEDQRGIITVAASFNSYNVALTWNSTSGVSALTLYAHQETATVGNSTYYLLKNSSADASGLTLNASAGSIGRQLMGKFVYPLTGVSSIPTSAWTLNYRAWFSSSANTITFDSSSSGNNGNGATTITWKHTTGSGSNRTMIVGVSIKLSSGSEKVTSISYGSQSLTFLRADTDQGQNIRSEIWYLIAPSTGTSTVTVNLSANTKATGGSVTYSGVSQTPPVSGDSSGGSGSSSSPSASITVSTSNSFLVGNVAVRYPGNQAPSVVSEGAGQTMRWDNATTFQSPNSNNRDHGSEMGPVTGSLTMSWNLSGSADWAVSIVTLKPTVQPPSVHGDINISILRSDGTIRTAIATNVAPSANFTSAPTTLSGTYSWVNYTVVDQTDYLEIDYYVDVSTAMSGVNVHLRIDDTTLALSNQTSATNVLFVSTNVDLYSLSKQGTITVELLQDGTMRWLGQNLVLTNSNSTLPVPPVPVKSIHVNETINGVNGEVPFQIEDWSSGYQVPQGLTSNMSLFSGRTMLVFLATSNTSKVTMWWNGSDTATQTPLAYTNRYFNDSPGSGIISNRLATLRFQGNFEPVTFTVGNSSSTANFMQINGNPGYYGAGPSYVITSGVVRDIVHQEAEWQNGGVTNPNCSDVYSDIVLTLPANATYYTYQLSLFFVQSQQNRTINNLCPVQLTSLTGQVQTENGTANGLPIVSNATDLFYNYSVSTWAHHWSQIISGTTGAGIMFTDNANQYLYIFDTITGIKTGGLNTNSTGTIQLTPVAKSQLTFNTTLDSRMQDMIWYGAVATFNTTATSIYNSTDQTGLWILVEYPPTVAVTGVNIQL